MPAKTIPALPDTPTMPVSTLADLFGVSTWSMYQSIRRGECPVPVVRVGRRIVVPTAPVRELLGLR